VTEDDEEITPIPKERGLQFSGGGKEGKTLGEEKKEGG